MWPGSILTPSPTRLFGRWIFFCASWKFWRKTEIQLRNIIIRCLKTTQQLPLNCDDFAELYRGHFSCRQLYLQLAQFQISQDFCIFAKTRIAGFAKTFCQRMLAPANVQKFIDTIWNLSQSHGSLFFWNIFTCHININIPTCRSLLCRKCCHPCGKKTSYKIERKCPFFLVSYHMEAA